MTTEQHIAEIRALTIGAKKRFVEQSADHAVARQLIEHLDTLAAECLRLREDKERLDGAAKHIGNIDLYVKPVAGMLISQPMICDGESLRECLDKISQALDAAKEAK